MLRNVNSVTNNLRLISQFMNDTYAQPLREYVFLLESVMKDGAAFVSEDNATQSTRLIAHIVYDAEKLILQWLNEGNDPDAVMGNANLLSEEQLSSKPVGLICLLTASLKSPQHLLDAATPERSCSAEHRIVTYMYWKFSKKTIGHWKMSYNMSLAYLYQRSNMLCMLEMK